MSKPQDADSATCLEQEVNLESWAQLAFENRLFKHIIDELMEGVYITDSEERILWINKIFEESDRKVRRKILGRTEEEVYREIGRFHRYTTLTGRPVDWRMAYYYLPCGHRTDLYITMRPYCENGVLKAVYSLGYVASQTKKLLRVVTELNRQAAATPKAGKNGTRYTFEDIIGAGQEIREAVKVARKAAGTDSSVFICGETGTGKELFAQSIHNAGARAEGPFTAINCSAIPESLLEGLLFGTAKGAFTGAVDNPGIFEMAQGGTLFLDEINSMPIGVQTKILRVLQERTVQRLGERRQRRIDFRVISASSAAPFEAISNQSLRRDLYFRLSAVQLNVPPLRARLDDILPLSLFFIKKIEQPAGVQVTGISPRAVELLLTHPWTGNVRELEHAIEHAMIMMEADETLIQPHHLPPQIALAKTIPPPSQSSSAFPSAAETPQDLKSAVEELSIRLIKTALKRNEGNLTRAAAELGLSRQVLTSKMKKLSLY